MHEMDADKEIREELGAEGVYDVVNRTKKSLAIMERYAKIFHANNPFECWIYFLLSSSKKLLPFAYITGSTFISL